MNIANKVNIQDIERLYSFLKRNIGNIVTINGRKEMLIIKLHVLCYRIIHKKICFLHLNLIFIELKSVYIISTIKISNLNKIKKNSIIKNKYRT